MADHRAEQIVSAVVANVTGLTTTATRVYRGRVYPMQESEFPGLCVYLGDDSPSVPRQNVAFIDSDLTVNIDAYVKSSSAQIDSLLMTIRKEVTIALMASRSQGLSFVHDTEEGQTSEPQLNGEGDKPVAVLRMPWMFRYRRSVTDPSA